jgi:hypothetical protein
MRKYKGLHAAANMAGTPGLGSNRVNQPFVFSSHVSARTSDNGTERRICKYRSFESDFLE